MSGEKDGAVLVGGASGGEHGIDMEGDSGDGSGERGEAGI